MWDLVKSRHALASGAAVLAAAIIGALFWSSPDLRSRVSGSLHGAMSPADSPASPVAATSEPAATGLPPVATASTEVASKQAAPSPEPLTTPMATPPAVSTGSAPMGGTPSNEGPAAKTEGSALAMVGEPSSTPSFDIVRVTPGGDSVIAARAAPNVDIALMDGDVVIARAKTDASGQVAFLPQPLKPGEHSLALAVGGSGSGPVVSSQSVAVSVPAAPQAPAMVAVLQPNQGATILSGPVAGTAAPASGAPASADTMPATSADATDPSAPVAIQSVEIEDQGSFYAGGKATPGSQCRVYLNGSFVATVTADGKGLWSLQIKRGMRPGHYAVRVDQVETKSGKVTARAEVPFDYPLGATAAVMPPDLNRKTASIRPGVATTASGAQHLASATASPSLPRTSPAGQPNVQDGRAMVPAATSSVGGKTADASAATGTSVADADLAAVPTVVDELLTAKVSRGDTLWRISRKMLGHGVRYTQIYAANTQQIRNPRLIYPGQIFVMPKT